MKMTSSLHFLNEDDDAALSRDDTAVPMPAEERSAQVYRWGRRLSGVTCSPGGAISCVQYDKTLEGRLRNKRFMEASWRAAGWDGKASVIQHEARVRRDARRTLGLPSEIQGSLDDPWSFREHVAKVWGYIVGQAPNADKGSAGYAPLSLPGNVAWIRRVVPDADSSATFR